MIRHGAALLLAALLAGAAGAAPLDLYATRVALEGAGGTALDTAFARALGDVFVKVSGDRRAAAAVSTREAGQLVRQYQPQAGGFIQVRFDPAGVRARLDAARLPVWGAARPTVLLLAPDATPSAPPAAGAGDPLEVAATARGLPLARAPATPADGGLPDAALLARAAERGATAVLVGRPEPSLGAAAFRWTLVGPEPDGRVEWTGDAVAGVNGAADRLAQRYAAPPGSVADIAIRITGVTTFDGYLRLATWLEAQDGIEAAAVTGAGPEGLRYLLRVRGGAAQLRALEGQRRILAAVAGDGAEPVYRLVGLP